MKKKTREKSFLEVNTDYLLIYERLLKESVAIKERARENARKQGKIDDDKEQPALISGSKTFFSGLISFAVSAMKCTPHITIKSALVFAASTANASESAEKSEIP